MNVTVVVPVYQDWHKVGKLLEGMVSQSLPASMWQLLLVDNGSDVVPDVKDLPEFVTLLRCEKPGSYAARNKAVCNSVGELLAFTDADCCPARDWLNNLWQAYLSSDKKSLIAGGIEVAKLGEGKQSLVELYDMALGLSQARYAANGYAATANLAVPRAIFDRIGLFDDSRMSGGDKEFCLRAQAAGYLLRYHQDALIYHPARQHWSEMVTKVKRVKGGKVCCGSTKSRVGNALRTYMPPVWACLSIIKNRRFSMSQRIGILWLQCRLWCVEMVEVTRLLLGKRPERR